MVLLWLVKLQLENKYKSWVWKVMKDNNLAFENESIGMWSLIEKPF